MEENTKKTCNGCGASEGQDTESFAMQLLRGYAKQNKRWFITCMVILSMWLATIAGFVWYLYQYDFVSETITVDTTDGGNAYYSEQSGDGVINYGEDSGKTKEAN